MYEAYFHLKKRPFCATPDPTCFFAPGSVQELFDELILRAESGQGIGILTAEAGTGKTLICRRIAVELGGRFTPVFLANANVPTRRALLQSILFELNRRFSRLEEQELRLAVYAAFRELALSGRGVVLIVDEAHLLNERLLEELRMLASLAEGEEPLARLVLAGQAPLEERLAEPALEALNQRIVCQVYLEPLTRQQSIDYVKFRIRWAGGEAGRIFTPEAFELIAAACNGLPRCLNQLCDHALLLTYVQEQPRVTDEAVREALEDLKQLPLHWNAPVAADTPLDARDDDSALDEFVEDVDEVSLSLEDVADLAAAPDQGATVCFEIGGLPPETGPESVSTTGTRNMQASPSPSDRPEQTRVSDEPVDDLYAALDVNTPRVRRTFEDCAVPESWPPSRAACDSDMPLPAAPPVGASSGTQRSMEVTETRLPVIAESMEGNAETGAAPGESSEYVSFANLDVGSRLTFDGIDPAGPSIEEQLGSSILDTCMDVRAEVGHWHASDGTFNAIDRGHDLLRDDDIARPVPGNDYDVIEPAMTRGTADHEGAAPDADPSDLPSAARYVPKPKYRHIFSTLRKRLGRGLIGKR
jgi:type II secretory pathway predicted ATPase ExeA